MVCVLDLMSVCVLMDGRETTVLRVNPPNVLYSLRAIEMNTL